MHQCMLCEHQTDLQPPLSMVVPGLQMGFNCKNCPYPDAYGEPSIDGSLIYDLLKDIAWVDGSVTVENCPNFTVRPGIDLGFLDAGKLIVDHFKEEQNTQPIAPTDK